jgi:jumonji domain-containing protein 2
MNLLSINYLHAGAPKYWYAIAPEDAKRFESFAESHFSLARKECKEFLRHKRYMVSPAILKKAGIPYTTQIQRPGDASE